MGCCRLGLAVWVGVFCIILMNMGCAGSADRAAPAVRQPMSLSIHPSTATHPSAPDELRVMSFNLRVATMIDGFNTWGVRKGVLVETIRRFNPDLLGTQECLAQQADYLREHLPEYQFVGVGRDDGKRKGEMCGIFFRTDRFALVDQGHLWLSEHPERAGSKSWGTVFPRMVTWVKLRGRDGQELCFFNTHLEAFHSGARLAQSKMLRQRMTHIAGNLPVLLTGDFNTDVQTEPHRVLTGSASERLIDTFASMHPHNSREHNTLHHFTGSRSGARIDWILASPVFQPLQAEIDRYRANGRYPSDHFPIEVVLRRVSRVAVN